MCGIYFCLSRADPRPPDDKLQERLKRRGPDAGNIQQRRLFPSALEGAVQPEIHLTFLSTVLALRGDTVVQQPLTDAASGSMLCWNGEAWRYENDTIDGNDGAVVFERLLLAAFNTAAGTDRRATVDHIFRSLLSTISHIQGPYSFVLYDAPHQCIFFGRDPLGRRSLLYRTDEAGQVIISSAADDERTNPWTEASLDGIGCLDLLSSKPCEAQHLPWGCRLGGHSLHPSLPIYSRRHVRINRSETPLGAVFDVSALSELHQRMRLAMELRLENVPAPLQHRAERIAILFSGGIDCSILARLAHDIMSLSEPIALLNVAFENPRVIAAARRLNQDILESDASTNCYATCPDRANGLAGLVELQQVCPGRDWRFVSINVPYKEMLSHKSEVIALMYPNDTEMDLSIGLALYFAARGQGTRGSSTQERPYTTTARVLLSGLGADELFAGYTRHQTAFDRGGSSGLLDELELDIERIGNRNLSRDDRLISNWAKEVRYPYLDESLVSWALNLPLWQKCSFGMESRQTEDHPVGPTLEPGKHLLRLLAWRLGLQRAAQEKKRAIQFGARTAKMLTGKVRGTQSLID